MSGTRRLLQFLFFLCVFLLNSYLTWQRWLRLTTEGDKSAATPWLHESSHGATLPAARIEPLARSRGCSRLPRIGHAVLRSSGLAEPAQCETPQHEAQSAAAGNTSDRLADHPAAVEPMFLVLLAERIETSVCDLNRPPSEAGTKHDGAAATADLAATAQGDGDWISG